MQLNKSMFMLSGICCLFLCSSAFAAYIDNGDGTVTDTGTGLMWQQTTGGYYTWVQALAYCENLNLAGYTDWRLPTAKELASIVDTTKDNPAINTTYFPGTASNFYWSSSTYFNGIDGAWYVSFNDGYVYSYLKPYQYYVRAVRSGQSGSFAN